jgi:hypothetical protein
MLENTITIYDVATGEITERSMTTEEIANLSKLAEEDQERVESNKATKASALAKLAALGLTEEEIAAL